MKIHGQSLIELLNHSNGNSGYFSYSNENQNPMSAGEVTIWNVLHCQQAKGTEDKLWYNVIFIKVIFSSSNWFCNISLTLSCIKKRFSKSGLRSWQMNLIMLCIVLWQWQILHKNNSNKQAVSSFQNKRLCFNFSVNSKNLRPLQCQTL